MHVKLELYNLKILLSDPMFLRFLWLVSTWVFNKGFLMHRDIYHHLDVLQFYIVLTLPGNSDQIHRIRASTHRTALYFRCRCQDQVFTYASAMPVVDIEIPTSPSSGSVNLPELPTECKKKHFFLLGHQLIIKGYKLGHRTWFGRRVWTFHILTRLYSIHLKSE